MNIFDFETYIFDCDGVILDTNRVKINCFMKTISSYDCNKQDQFLRYLIENGGVTRDLKYRYFLKEIVGIEDKEKVDCLAKDLVRDFSEKVQVELAQSIFTKGFLAFIDKLKSRGKKIYVWTGGRESEVIKMIHDKGIDSFFSGVYGAPGGKEESLKRLVAKEKISTDKTIIIGDSEEDLKGAMLLNIMFLFISGYTDITLSTKNTINDFESIESIKLMRG